MAKQLNLNNSIFFYSHYGEFGFLSNFYPTQIKFREYIFPSSEHLYMWKKARFFEDLETSNKILHADSPRKAKQLGRLVANFDENIWKLHCGPAMISTLLHKFNDMTMRRKLLSTYDKYLVEASPTDKIWGIGMSDSDPDRFDDTKWIGENLLGNCLMQIRTFYYEVNS